MSFKALKNFNLKAIDLTGFGEAVIATLNVIDKDNDITMRGAFGEGQTVKMIPAHDWSHVPLGKATIHEVGEEVIAKFQLNLDIEAAREWHSALLFDLKEGDAIQEWSYGFTIIDSEQRTEGTDTRVRVLKSLKVHEISPVIVGAGDNTRTLSIKSEKHGGTLAEHLSETIENVKQVAERCIEVKTLREEDGRNLSTARIEQLKELEWQLSEVNEVLAKLVEPAEEPGKDVKETDQDEARQLFSGFVMSSLNVRA